MAVTKPSSGPASLRAAFPPEQIHKLPRITCRDCAKRQCTTHARQRCDICRNFITTAHIHLDYVGHAEVTARLLDVDPHWTWEPFALDVDGLPKVDRFGGLWIRLTVLGDTRLGYGDAVGKEPGPSAIKEMIGDAIRNAAMRFGVALDLWARSDLHVHADPRDTEATTAASGAAPLSPACADGMTRGPHPRDPWQIPDPATDYAAWLEYVRDGIASAPTWPALEVLRRSVAGAKHLLRPGDRDTLFLADQARVTELKAMEASAA